MTVTNLVELGKIKDEIINFLRFNITDPSSRGTARTALLNGTGLATDFYIASATANCVTRVQHPVLTTLSFGTGYTFDTDYVSGTKQLKISFMTPPVSGTNNIEVLYRDGATWVYPDYPQVQSTLTNFPRIVVDVIGGISSEQSLDGAHKNTILNISITVYDFQTERLDGIIDDVRNNLLSAQKSFYYTKYLSVGNMSPLIYTQGTNNKIFQRTIDFDSLWNFEVVS